MTTVERDAVFADELLGATPGSSNVSLLDLSAASRPRLDELLDLEVPAGLFAEAAFAQIRYIDDYVRHPGGFARSALLEHRYIDRHWSSDHAAFYARSLRAIGNICRRIHFFRVSHAELASRIGVLQVLAAGLDRAVFDSACRQFSDEAYLGYVVIRPLPGVPVGTTVLRPYPSAPLGGDRGFARRFYATRLYTAHVLGLRLEVPALGFQQQDVGVAACATTAIWVSLQQVRPDEEFPPTSPSDITRRASGGRVQAGREMPSVGLTPEQMCAAIRDFGLAPTMSAAHDAWLGKAEILANLRSHRSPILVLEALDDPRRHHAVAVVGAKLPSGPRTPEAPLPDVRVLDDEVYDVEDLYVHDDRLGPYVLGRLSLSAPVASAGCLGGSADSGCLEFITDALTALEQEEPRASAALLMREGIRARSTATDARGLVLSLRTVKPRRGPGVMVDDISAGESVADEQLAEQFDAGWKVTAILTPTHRKQHFSCGELLALGLDDLLARVQVKWGSVQASFEDPRTTDVSVEVTIPRGKNYAWALLHGEPDPVASLATSSATAFIRETATSRYVGVLRYRLRPSRDWIDVIVDTTSTLRSPHFLAVLATFNQGEIGYEIARQIAAHLRVPFFSGRRDAIGAEQGPI